MFVQRENLSPENIAKKQILSLSLIGDVTKVMEKQVFFCSPFSHCHFINIFLLLNRFVKYDKEKTEE